MRRVRAGVAIPLAAVDEVKLHIVSIASYYEVGLSLITIKLGRPIMLDAYTSSMCLKSWGCATYARALVEVSCKKDLLDSLVKAIPFQNRLGHSMETTDIEYEWQPPHCVHVKSLIILMINVLRRQAGTVVDNHNHNVNHSRITRMGKSRIEVMESSRKDFENSDYNESKFLHNAYFHTFCNYIVDKSNRLKDIHTIATRQAGTVVDNHNHNVNHSRITRMGKSRIEVMESSRKDFENSDYNESKFLHNAYFHTFCNYIVDKSNRLKDIHTIATRQHGRMILKSVENGPLLWPTVEENGVTRPKKYYELSTTESIQADCDGRQNSMTAGMSRQYTSGPSGTLEKQRVIVCYNCKGEGHMSKKCTKPKRKKDEAWFKDKIALMANLSHYGSDNLAEVHNQDNVTTNVIHHDRQVTSTSEQSNNLNQSETEITSDSNIISYSQYMNESQYTTVQNLSSPALQDDLILSVSEQLKTQVVNCTKINQDKKNVNEILTADLERYKDQVRILKEQNNVDKALASCTQSLEIENLKHTFSEHLKEKKSLEQKTVHMLTKPQFFYDHSTRQALGFQNPCYLKKAQQLEPKLYDGSVIQKNDAIVISDSEKTLMLEDESRFKMLQKQKDPLMSEKKTELSAEQAFWSQNSANSEESNLSSSTTIVKVPKELPKVSMVNSILKKLKFHLASFDMVVKERTTATAITKGEWGFKHTKACFRDEIIPFVKALKELFNSFDQFLIDELTEVQNIFIQMKQVVEQHCVEKNKF
nr:hypothetical protein [Tanacetum cinerariifolium]